MTVKNLTDENYTHEIKSLNDKAILDFYGEYCQPCKTFAPIFEEMSRKYEGKINFYKIDVLQNPKIASRFSIRALPSIILLQGSSIIGMKVGAMSASALEEFLLKNI